MEIKNNSGGKSVLLIINPKAGRTTSKQKSEALVKIFRKYGFNPELHITEYAGHATELVKSMGDDFDVIACVGGDGTLHEVISGFMQTERRAQIGYIPAGTTNDFSKGIKLPKMPDVAVASMAKGKVQTVDCGDFNGDKFIYVASFGAFSKVSYATPQDMKNMFGRSAYIFDGIQSVFDIRPYHARITTDDAVYEDDFIFCGITNSYSVGGLINLPRDYVNLSDGKFELLLIRSVENPEDLPDTIHACIDFNFDHENVILTQSSTVKIELDEKTPFTLDGEFAGELDYAEIKNINPGYDLLIPVIKDF